MGAGGSKTVTSTNVRTKAAVDALVENIMNCSSNTYIKQTFTIVGNYNVVSNVKQVQYLNISSNCIQDANSLTNMQQAVSAALQAAANSQSVSVLGVLGQSTAEVNTTIDNEVKQVLTQKNIQNIINQTNADQTVLIAGNNNIIDNFSQDQTAQVLFDNAQKVLNQMTSVQAINNVSDSKSTATQTNFISDIVDSIFKGVTSLSYVWVIVIIALIIGAVILGPDLLKILPTYGLFSEGSVPRNLDNQ